MSARVSLNAHLKAFCSLIVFFKNVFDYPENCLHVNEITLVKNISANCSYHKLLFYINFETFFSPPTTLFQLSFSNVSLQCHMKPEPFISDLPRLEFLSGSQLQQLYQ